MEMASKESDHNSQSFPPLKLNATFCSLFRIIVAQEVQGLLAWNVSECRLRAVQVAFIGGSY